MFERLILLVVFSFAVGGAWLAVRWWLQWRARRIQTEPVPAELSALGLRAETPTILYFTTPTCGICRLQQEPILKQVAQILPEQVSITKLDAVEHDSLARHYGVFTVPTTVILDQKRSSLHINHGLATTPILLGQLQPLLHKNVQSGAFLEEIAGGRAHQTLITS